LRPSLSTGPGPTAIWIRSRMISIEIKNSHHGDTENTERNRKSLFRLFPPP
jgi:hypothetical protein